MGGGLFDIPCLRGKGNALFVALLFTIDFAVLMLLITTCLPPFSTGALRGDGTPCGRRDKVLADIILIIAVPSLALLGWTTYMSATDPYFL